VRLDHVVLAASDWDRSMAFCCDVLGVQVGGAQVVGATGAGDLCTRDRGRPGCRRAIAEVSKGDQALDR
jgi:catechol 2,3-dioxygenase-like lactoylglutathione lyase family enzyme